MEPLQFLAWVIVHIGVPIFAPIALLPLLGIGGCCYELAGYLEYAVPPGRNMAWAGWGAVHSFLE